MCHAHHALLCSATLPCSLKSDTGATLGWCLLIWLNERKGQYTCGTLLWCCCAISLSGLSLSHLLTISLSHIHSLIHCLFLSLSLSLPVSFIHNLCYIDEGESVVTDTQESTNLFQVKWQTELALLFSLLCLFFYSFSAMSQRQPQLL